MRLILAALAIAGAMQLARAEGISARDVVTAWPSQRATAGGYATYYDCKRAGECSASKRTASGARFDPRAHACAHRAYPFGTRLRVTLGGRSAVCVVNDRGPARRTGNTIDVTPAIAELLGLAGRAFVSIERL